MVAIPSLHPLISHSLISALSISYLLMALHSSVLSVFVPGSVLLFYTSWTFMDKIHGQYSHIILFIYALGRLFCLKLGGI